MTVLSYTQQKQLHLDHLNGNLTDKDLAKKYDITTKALAKIIESPLVDRSELEKGITAVNIARETTRITEIKSLLMDVMQKIPEGILNELEKGTMTLSDIQRWIPDMRGITSDLDRIQRLNTAQPTSIEEHRSISVLLDRIEQNQSPLIQHGSDEYNSKTS